MLTWRLMAIFVLMWGPDHLFLLPSLAAISSSPHHQPLAKYGFLGTQELAREISLTNLGSGFLGTQKIVREREISLMNPDASGFAREIPHETQVASKLAREIPTKPRSHLGSSRGGTQIAIWVPPRKGTQMHLGFARETQSGFPYCDGGSGGRREGVGEEEGRSNSGRGAAVEGRSLGVVGPTKGLVCMWVQWIFNPSQLSAHKPPRVYHTVSISAT